jgi:hypothetical protein
MTGAKMRSNNNMDQVNDSEVHMEPAVEDYGREDDEGVPYEGHGHWVSAGCLHIDEAQTWRKETSCMRLMEAEIVLRSIEIPSIYEQPLRGFHPQSRTMQEKGLRRISSW